MSQQFVGGSAHALADTGALTSEDTAEGLRKQHHQCGTVSLGNTENSQKLLQEESAAS